MTLPVILITFMIIWTLLGASILSGMASMAGKDVFNIVGREDRLLVFISGPIFWVLYLKNNHIRKE